MTKQTPRFKWRAAYDGSEQQAGADCMTFCLDESRTQQSFAEDADLNVIVQRFGIEHAQLPPMAQDPSYFGDFSDVPDLRTAMDLVRDAQNRFLELPTKLRERFGNSPIRLWHFVNDPENAEEAVRLGLLRAPEPPTPAPPTPAPETDTP